MPRKTQLTAARLLTPAELVALNGGAFGMVTDRAWGETNQSLPPAMRRAFEAEARFRQMLSAVDASFVEIERLAVLGGDPAPDSASRKIPEGRWSYHPGGYFVRFFPSGYSRTEVHVYVPEPMTLVRDSAGRIAAITINEAQARHSTAGTTAEPQSGTPHGARFSSSPRLQASTSRACHATCATWKTWRSCSSGWRRPRTQPATARTPAGCPRPSSSSTRRGRRRFARRLADASAARARIQSISPKPSPSRVIVVASDLGSPGAVSGDGRLL